MKKGIDVSRWQGVINFDALHGAIDFIVIKAAGSDQGLYPDGQFARNRDEARRLNIPRMFYTFLGGVFDPVTEADHFLSVVGPMQPGEGLVLDWESNNPNEVEYIRAIAQRIKAVVGFPPLIYMSLSRVRGSNWQPVVDVGCGLWAAAWGNNDTIPDIAPSSGQWPFWALWQYSSNGSIPGINALVDLDLFQGDDLAAFAKYGAPGATPSVPAPVPAPAPTPTPAPSVPVGEYVVVSGDNLTTIGAKFGVSWNTIFARNTDRISNPNTIGIGLRLRVPGGSAPTPGPQLEFYVVVPGDNLSKIAANYHTTWNQIYNWNKSIIGNDPNVIKVGQRLRVR